MLSVIANLLFERHVAEKRRSPLSANARGFKVFLKFAV